LEPPKLLLDVGAPDPDERIRPLPTAVLLQLSEVRYFAVEMARQDVDPESLAHLEDPP
jgi:hypothetical protein